MAFAFNTSYASVDMLRERAKLKIPKFAFEYLDGGCNNELNLAKNTKEIRDIELKPIYTKPFASADLKTSILGMEYDLPFGISPIGLQGLMWPGASEILAKAAFESNIPYILSTVGTADIETIAKITEGKAWFQLYHPKDISIRDQLIQRCKDVDVPVLVILADVPSFGYRPKEIKNGLSIPPKMTLRNIAQIVARPHWALSILKHGQPSFKTLAPYIPKNLSLKHLGLFMNNMFSGRIDENRIGQIRDLWKGKLVVKGIESRVDADVMIKLGIDGIIVSNHGGRQLDQAQSSIRALDNLVPLYKDKITIMMDSGIRSGTDIAGVLASGAEFGFLGRSFMYGVAALGTHGGDQVIHILKTELKQVMEQVGCENPNKLHNFLLGRK